MRILLVGVSGTMGRAGTLDAVASAAGQVTFALFADMQAEDYALGLRDKLMGQADPRYPVSSVAA